MSGDSKYIIDTNILIYYFNGNISLDSIINTASFIGISIVSYIEFLGYPNLSKTDISKFNSFVKLVNVIELPGYKTHPDFYELIINIKKKHKIKLPDSLIVGQALTNNFILISNDKLLGKIKNLKIINL